ncbi:glutamate--tRNA ligase [Anaerolineales bacterium]
MTEANRPVRTRYAPSPTGPQHIGGLRSALFSWLLARHHQGQFILRIEDTDQKRFVEGSLEMIMDALKWLGLNWDEGPDIGGPYGPYIQSERVELHQKWAHWLVDNGKAYHCFCTEERLKEVNDEKIANKQPPGYDRHCRNLSAEEVAQKLEAGIPSVIRFKIPLEGKTIGQDLIRGDVEFDNSTLQDIVILKSDGFPTYHLAHVVDDHFMEISHVTRANEWLPSLPVHLQLWYAFGWEIPYYAHLPVLLNPNGKGKLSKRHAAFDESGQKVLVLAQEYVDAGYEAEAVVNFLTNIGWNYGDEVEIFSSEEAIQRFDISAVNPSNSAFPIEKLDWMNGVYIRNMDLAELEAKLQAVFEKAGYETDPDKLKLLTPVVQTRLKLVNDVIELAGFVFEDYAAFKGASAELLIPKKMDAETCKAMLERCLTELEGFEPFEHQALYEHMKEIAKEIGVKNGQIFGALRVALTGQEISTPTFETMEILGKAETLRRIKMAINVL